MASNQARLATISLVDPRRDPDSTLHFETLPATAPRPLTGSSAPLRVDIAGAGRMISLAEWTELTCGTSLIVLVGGQIVHEWYAPGVTAHTPLLGASMTKSVLAHLVGMAVGDGAIAVTDPVVAHVPELAGSGYRDCRVLDVLTMTSGVDWIEDHWDPTTLASQLLARFAGPGGDSRELLTRVGYGIPPGQRYSYCTADSQVLDWVRERASGESYLAALQRLWEAAGCTGEAVVATDAHAVPMAGGGLAARARDWATLAALQIDGSRDGRRVLSTEWVDAASRPVYPFVLPGRLPSTITTHAGFGYHWWPLDPEGRTLTSDGSRGQFGYVDRDRDVVVLKTSQWPYDDFVSDRQRRDLCYLGLPVIARVAAQAASSTHPHQSGGDRA